MRIGSVSYEAPFMLAPLAGVSDSPFRQLAREQGAALVYTEMVSADGLAVLRGDTAVAAGEDVEVIVLRGVSP